MRPLRIRVLTDKPDHPLLVAATGLLASHHDVGFLDPGAVRTARDDEPLADVYLLKSHTPRAISLARDWERRGAVVLNTAAATERCQDRVRMAETARGAGLPFPATRQVTTPARLWAGSGARRGAGGPTGPGPALCSAGPAETAVPAAAYPFIVKSRRNRRGDLVARVDDADGLRALAARWPDEEIVVQDFTLGDGWDHKLWVIAGQVFTGLRRTPLDPGPITGPASGSGSGPGSSLGLGLGPGLGQTTAAPPPPPGAADLALRAGAAFGLDIYGVDVMEDDGRALIVDVNAFPGIRGQAGAPAALAALAVHAARTGPSRTGSSQNLGRLTV